MYLHVGRSRVIREKNIIGIFDADKATVSNITKDFLRRCESDSLTESATYDVPRSFVLYKDDFDPTVEKVCFSQISTSSLVRRIGKITEK